MVHLNAVVSFASFCGLLSTVVMCSDVLQTDLGPFTFLTTHQTLSSLEELKIC